MFDIELTDVDHPLIHKANGLLAADAPDFERIVILRDRRWFKVKTGRHRGAITRDADGQWWLGAAGLRKDDGSGDFYEDLERYADDSTALAPTEEDRRYLRFERAHAAELEEERAATRQLIELVLAAVAAPGSAQSLTLWGAVVTVRVLPPTEDDDIGRIVIEFTFEHWEQRDRFPYDLLALVPFVCEPGEWDYLPDLGSGAGETWYTYVAPDWIEWFATTVELENLEHLLDRVERSVTTASATEACHFVSRNVVVAAMVESVEVRALCGYRFVPNRDPTRFPMCERCLELRELLRKLAAPSE